MRNIIYVFAMCALFGCKKTGEVNNHRFPNGAHVWIKKTSRKSFEAEGYDVKHYWIVDSLGRESFTSYSMNFYNLHNESGVVFINVPDDDLQSNKPNWLPWPL